MVISTLKTMPIATMQIGGCSKFNTKHLRTLRVTCRSDSFLLVQHMPSCRCYKAYMFLSFSHDAQPILPNAFYRVKVGDHACLKGSFANCPCLWSWHHVLKAYGYDCRHAAAQQRYQAWSWRQQLGCSPCPWVLNLFWAKWA